jgi:hypothetical protein
MLRELNDELVNTPAPIYVATKGVLAYAVKPPTVTVIGA